MLNQTFLTLCQYELKAMRECLTNDPSLTRAVYLRECYPPGSRKSEYYRELENVLRNGAVMLPQAVCRSLALHFGPDCLAQLNRFYACIPANICFQTGEILKLGWQP